MNRPNTGFADATYRRSLEFMLQWEGGYVKHPLDPGGATNFGVTQKVYDSYRSRNKSGHRSVKLIDRTEVEDIYFNNYWKESRANTLPYPLSMVHFDTAVNFGIRRATEFLQKAVGANPDGLWGAKTDASIAAADLDTVVRNYCRIRMDYRYSRVKAKPSQVVFLKGWLRRDKALLALAEIKLADRNKSKAILEATKR